MLFLISLDDPDVPLRMPRGSINQQNSSGPSLEYGPTVGFIELLLVCSALSCLVCKHPRSRVLTRRELALVFFISDMTGTMAP